MDVNAAETGKDKKTSVPGPMGRTVLHLLIIAAIGALVYSNTLNAPFQWDEKVLIEKNAIVHDLGNFLSPQKAEGERFYASLVMRYVGYLTFALNYAAGGLDVRGYHMVNIVIHLINALLVYLLAALTFKTPTLGGSRISGSAGTVALFSALIFVAHPLQTEAVTYIFQRLASLAALFYLLSLTSYIMSRLSETQKGRYGFYLLSLASAVLAMKTKENAFTLPIAIAMYEFMFFKGRPGVRALWLLPLMLTLLIIPLSLVSAGAPVGRMLSGSTEALVGQEMVSASDYLLTQFRVLLTYLRLLVLPINQNIDYDYPIYRSFLEPEVFMSFISLCAVFLSGIYMLKRSAKGDPALRVVSFGIFWFFLTLSVESSVIPIPMLINEYRMYLPGAGLIVAITAGIFLLISRHVPPQRARATAVATLCVVVTVLSAITFARNSVWGTEVSLWEDTAKKSPQKARVRRYLGNAYSKNGLDKEAIGELSASLRLNPYSVKTYNDLGSACKRAGRIIEAEVHYKAALRFDAGFSEAHYNLGLIHLERGMFQDAQREFKEVLRLEPGDVGAMRLLREAEARLGR